MTSLDAIRNACEAFLAQIQGQKEDRMEHLRELAKSFDKLTATYFEVDDVEPDSEDSLAPPIDYVVLYKRAANAFPELGCYPAIDVGGTLGEEEALVADAIDDLADIARDLSEVLWHIEKSSEADAIWEFRFGYQSHWGAHLHRLRHYLHSSRIAAW
ncbi:DUF5063 domain-containing protein [Erythrobacter sp. JK5]|uniref:DUF5063 domain-containing protein n=1 Tax=Erythrobacter sp. JK5 TaxID=2829500 RepID=UPI001BAB8CCB|nr:DUF5063 domain-containing protein [Erythrobacter sp. JK5]QUL37508.1 DUF5063 domain-containing protein [Erythrobacter sp. JK5]